MLVCYHGDTMLLNNLALVSTGYWKEICNFSLNSTSLTVCTFATGHNRSVLSVGWSNDNKWLLTGSVDKTAKVWCDGLSEPVLTVKSLTQKLNTDGSFSAKVGYHCLIKMFLKKSKRVQNNFLSNLLMM